MQDRLDAEENAVYSAMDEIIAEVNPVLSIPPSPELRLRRDLAEWAIRDAAWVEVMARAPEPSYWEREHSPGEQRKYEHLILADHEADGPARDREYELLADSRQPNWEADEPPPLTAKQATVLAKWVAAGAEYPSSRALDELRMNAGLEAQYIGDQECESPNRWKR